MPQQHLPDKDQAKPLPVRLRGEEGAEELGLRRLVDALARIGDLDADRFGIGMDIDRPPFPDRLGGVLQDIHQYLLEEDAIQRGDGLSGRQLRHDIDRPVVATILHETLARGDNLVQRARLAARLRYTYHIREAGDETAHAIATLNQDPQQFPDILHLLRIPQRRLQRIQGGSDAGGRIVHLVGDHAYDFLVSLLLGAEYLVRQDLYQIKGVLETPIDKRGMGAFVNTGVVQADRARLVHRDTGQLLRQG